MTLKINPKHLQNFLVLLPFLLVYGGTIFQNQIPEITSNSKILAFIYMFVYVIYQNKVSANLFMMTLVFIPLLIYGVFHSFDIRAGISDGIRYLFPVITLYYGYSIKDKFGLLLQFIVIFIVINFLVQIVNYINWIRGIEQWFYYKTTNGFVYANMTSGILRATGTVVFFGFYGFMNMIAFFIIDKYYQGRFKKLLLIMTMFSFLASLSYKTFGAFLIVSFFYYYKYVYKLIGYIVAVCLLVVFTLSSKVQSFIDDILLRINLYITEGDSMRSESYRVMFNEIKNFNLFGRGVGSFGGPASIAYDSPFYEEVFFNWFDTSWMNLPTTDTYPPHLFVELGLIGGIVYLILLFTPLLRNRLTSEYKIVLLIYFTLFVDMLFSFSLNNIEYLMFSLVFVYPIFAQNSSKQHEV